MLLSRKAIGLIAILGIIILAFVMRITVLPAVTDDMAYFLIPWYDHFAKFGLHGIATIDSNYNVPYLYLLWLSTHLPFSPIDSIKSITVVFEMIFAMVVYFIAKDYYPKQKNIPYIFAVGSLFIPTLFLQGALWGQCDIIYTTFLVSSWWALSKDKHALGWLLFGVALAFKLQAIFFLPYIVFVWFSASRIQRPIRSRSNLRLLYPAIPFAAIIVAALPAFLLGRSVNSLVGIYAGQVNDPGTSMSLGSGASVFQLFVSMKDSSVVYLAKPAVAFTAALVIAIITSYILYLKKDGLKDKFVLPLLLLVIIPFFLPFMHDRYFFAAEVFAILFAALTRRKLFVVIAVLMQATALPFYASYLWHATIWSPSVLALIQLFVITVLLCVLYTGSSDKKSKTRVALR